MNTSIIKERKKERKRTWRKEKEIKALQASDDHTCLNCRMAPLTRNESAAIPAIPSAGSFNCLNDVELADIRKKFN